MRKLRFSVLLLMLLAVLAACSSGVSQEEYDQLQSDYAALQEDYTILQSDYADIQTQYEQAQEEIEELTASVDEAKAQLTKEKQARQEAERVAAGSTTSGADKSSAAQETMVWVSKTGSKYHSSSGCSNMKNPQQISITEAEARGLTACKNCC